MRFNTHAQNRTYTKWIKCTIRDTFPPNIEGEKIDTKIPTNAKTKYTLDGKQSALKVAEMFMIKYNIQEEIVGFFYLR